MTNKHILLSVLAVAALTFVGCDKATEQIPEITLTGNSAQLASSGLSVKAEGGESTLTFTSGADWTIDFAATKAMVSWVVATPASGKAGDAEVIVSVSANEELSARQAVLSILSGEIRTDIAIKQAGRERIPITGITLNETQLEVTIGDPVQLEATVTPSYTDDDKTVTWSSNKTTVATVDQSGLVQTVGVGTVVITATAGTKSATCTITVNPVVVLPESVSLDQEAVTLKVGKTVTLLATVSPEDATDKTLTWSTSDASVATVENGVVTAVAEGTATITVTTVNNKTATCVITVIPKGSTGEDLGDPIDENPWE